MKGNIPMKKALGCVVLLLIVALSASAANPTVEGSWKADVPRGNGRIVAAVFELSVDGDTLNGLVHAAAKEFTLVNGKIKGNEISFSVDGTSGFFTGEINGDELKMKVKYDGGENGSKTLSFVAVRVTN
jgi:hypothetical protein